jgi:hypothetical protein
VIATVLAAVRPHSWDLAVFVHVLGAMILVGGLVTATGAGVIGWRDAGGALRRFAALTLFAVALPGWIIMRVGAEWAYSKEGWNKVPSKLQPTWLGIGYLTADVGGLILLIALVLGGIGIRRMRSGGGTGLLKASTALAALLIVVYAVSVWAMGGKPT